MKHGRLYKIAFALSIILIMIMLVGFFFVGQFKTGILQVYARQQDAYVKLLLDQINLLGEDATTEDITLILSTMDSSNTKYWTLSEDDNIIFVKNIQETNRYKGFSTATFFASESGLDFLNEMKLNYVSHSFVNLDGETYVVSGTVFSFNERGYTLCLMTDKDMIVEENAFLSADIMIRIILAVMCIMAVFSMQVMGHICETKEKELNSVIKHNTELNQTIAKLNHRITRHDMFHPRWNLYQESVLDSFIEGFENKGVSDFGFCLLSFTSEESRNEFLEDAFVYLDRKVLRFQLDEDPLMLLLLFINFDEEMIKNSMEHFYLSDRSIAGIRITKEGEDAMQVFHNMVLQARGEDQ